MKASLASMSLLLLLLLLLLWGPPCGAQCFSNQSLVEGKLNLSYQKNCTWLDWNDFLGINNLTLLNLSHNQLTELRGSSQNLTISHLDLSANRLQMLLPDSLGPLEYLNLSGNPQLATVPPDVASRCSLKLRVDCRCNVAGSVVLARNCSSAQPECSHLQGQVLDLATFYSGCRNRRIALIAGVTAAVGAVIILGVGSIAVLVKRKHRRDVTVQEKWSSSVGSVAASQQPRYSSRSPVVLDGANSDEDYENVFEGSPVGVHLQERDSGDGISRVRLPEDESNYMNYKNLADIEQPVYCNLPDLGYCHSWELETNFQE
ncbi:leucine-rich repeat-containing protein 25 isoform X2 [Tachyglossus aculeatus]|uniref:leucine-rich repeat-containing protein 25 isoform X2 n=1 Tax=Tachyglossus aculeatus TaxID=9261 RepID=UPI0018F6735C|nr:leucine-rich repeat-containing protein 25 isoform X2 [Tachyglossus aculeatus]